LFRYIKKQYPSFNEKKLTKEVLFNVLYPEKNYNEQIIKNLFSELNKKLYEFLSISHYLNYRFYSNEINILSELNLKNLDNIFLLRYKSFENLLAESAHQIHPMFYYFYRAETEMVKFLLSRNRQHDVSEYVLNTGQWFLYHFLVEFTRIAIDINTNITSFNAPLEKNIVFEFLNHFDFDGFINYMEKNNFKYKDIIKVYYNRLIAVLSDDDQKYFLFKNSLLDNINSFSKAEKFNLLNSLYTLAINKVNKGKANFLEEQFYSVQKQIEHDVIAGPEGNQLSLMKVRNILFICILLDKKKWFTDFIDNLKDKINPNDRNNILNHSSGIIAFHSNDFEKSLAYFNKIEIENPFYAADVKTHQAMIYYELGHYESLLNLLDSFRHLISNRRDFVSTMKNININFINILKGIVKIKLNPEKLNHLELMEKLNKMGMVNHKNWLKKKLNEIENQKN
jgi:hypothetical protein